MRINKLIFVFTRAKRLIFLLFMLVILIPLWDQVLLKKFIGSVNKVNLDIIASLKLKEYNSTEEESVDERDDHCTVVPTCREKCPVL